MKMISLTQGKSALVDDADYDWLNEWKWYVRASGSRHTFYATRPVRVAKGKQRTEGMHRMILGFRLGDKQRADHCDGDGLNNQRANLRSCTIAQNEQSSRKWRSATSKYKGVCWKRDHSKWCSCIQVNKKQIHLGYFDSELVAALAYNQAALNYFGEFALLNSF